MHYTKHSWILHRPCAKFSTKKAATKSVQYTINIVYYKLQTFDKLLSFGACNFYYKNKKGHHYSYYALLHNLAQHQCIYCYVTWPYL